MSRFPILVCTYVCVIGACSVVCAPVLYELVAPTDYETSYMRRYGYFQGQEADNVESFTAYSLIEAVKKLQLFASLPPTGILDSATRKLFYKKRCGVPDIINRNRRKRFVVTKGWTNKTITYKVLNGSRNLPKPRVEELMAAALAVWAPHGELTFVRMDEKHADIEVSFATGFHGDTLAFDGPGLALAHAFGPPIGAMHFDDDENWSDINIASSEEDIDDVTDFYAVAVHETGHALGLHHSTVPQSVMFPYYQETVKLDEDDILGMHELYMKVSNPEDTTESNLMAPFTKNHPMEPEPADEDIPDICYSNYDTIQVLQGKIYVFEEEFVWVLSEMRKLEDGYPKPIHDVFIGLPKHVDAIRTIYEKRNGNIAIFSGRKFWEFSPSFKLIRVGNISEYKLPRYVTELSTVFLSNYNNKTYLIDSERFWRYDEDFSRMDKKYPKSMAAWREVPYPVEAALIWKGDTYFFQGPRFWRFDNELVQAHASYPQPMAAVWLPCDLTDEMITYTHVK